MANAAQSLPGYWIPDKIRDYKEPEEEVLAMKKLIITIVSLTTLGIGIAIPLQAKAEFVQFDYPGISFKLGHRVQRHYNVYYRYDEFDEWQFAGAYRDFDDADYAARRLERRGFIARIETRFQRRW
jgi:hypothetical protein